MGEKLHITSSSLLPSLLQLTTPHLNCKQFPLSLSFLPSFHLSLLLFAPSYLLFSCSLTPYSMTQVFSLPKEIQKEKKGKSFLTYQHLYINTIASTFQGCHIIYVSLVLKWLAIALSLSLSLLKAETNPELKKKMRKLRRMCRRNLWGLLVFIQLGCTLVICSGASLTD